MRKQDIVILEKPGRKELVVDFRKNGEEEEVLGLIIADQPGDYFLKILVDHKVGNTFGRVVVRGVAKNGAKVQVEGMIRIGKDANGVDDFLEMKILLLDEKSQAVAEPKLEIEANEVKASHAATVGKIDPEELFYLQSRGVKREGAEKLVVDGFLAEIVSRIQDPVMVSKISRKLVG